MAVQFTDTSPEHNNRGRCTIEVELVRRVGYLGSCNGGRGWREKTGINAIKYQIDPFYLAFPLALFSFV